MFKFVDTHCHLDLVARFGKSEGDLSQSELDIVQEIVSESAKAGLFKILNVGAQIEGCRNSLLLAKTFDPVVAVIGIHPTEFNFEGYKDKLGELRELLIANKGWSKLVGIGEIGLDFYHQGYNKSAQDYGLRSQVELAIELNLPISFHTRDASETFLKTIEQYAGQLSGAVMHCFSQDLNFARTVTGWGFFLGIGGTLTYPKNDRLVKVVEEIGPEYLLLETDAPFLSPQNKRGKVNHPTAVIDVAQKIAEIKGLDLSTVATITTANAERLFKID